MRDLAALAEQIRAVRDAQRLFMGRWRLEQVLVGPEVLDRLADDMAAAHAELDLPAGADVDTGAGYAGSVDYAAKAGFDAVGLGDAGPAVGPAAGEFGYPLPHRWSMYLNGGADAAS